MDELVERLECLRLANFKALEPGDVVALARAYLDFLQASRAPKVSAEQEGGERSPGD